MRRRFFFGFFFGGGGCVTKAAALRAHPGTPTGAGSGHTGRNFVNRTKAPRIWARRKKKTRWRAGFWRCTGVHPHISVTVTVTCHLAARCGPEPTGLLWARDGPWEATLGDGPGIDDGDCHGSGSDDGSCAQRGDVSAVHISQPQLQSRVAGNRQQVTRFGGLVGATVQHRPCWTGR